MAFLPPIGALLLPLPWYFPKIIGVAIVLGLLTGAVTWLVSKRVERLEASSIGLAAMVATATAVASAELVAGHEICKTAAEADLADVRFHTLRATFSEHFPVGGHALHAVAERSDGRRMIWSYLNMDWAPAPYQYWTLEDPYRTCE